MVMVKKSLVVNGNGKKSLMVEVENGKKKQSGKKWQL